MQEVGLSNRTSVWQSGSTLMLTQDQDTDTVTIEFTRDEFEAFVREGSKLLAFYALTSNVTTKVEPDASN